MRAQDSAEEYIFHGVHIDYLFYEYGLKLNQQWL